MADEDREIEIKTAVASARVRNYDFATMLVVAIGTLLIYMQFIQSQQQKEAYQVITAALNRIAYSQKESTCIQALPDTLKSKEIGDPESLCKRIARGS